jgi:hypothetical protein
VTVPKKNQTASGDCTKRRLAEGRVAVVDGCDCGVLQLHVGAVTLRLSACAVTSLVETLQHALHRVAGHELARAGESRLAHLPRGRA